MIEQGLYFALGFLVAALLSLGVLPAFWRRAYRLSRREIEATLPLSPREIAAERDQLRAIFAVERVQLENRVDKVEAARHKALSIAGEKAVRIGRLDEELSARRAEVAALEARAAGLEGDLAATRDALSATESTLAGVRGELGALQSEHRMLDATRVEAQGMADHRRVEIAAQKTNLEAQQARIEALDAGLKTARAETRACADELRETTRALREKDKDLAIALSRLASAEEIGERRAQIIAERDVLVEQLREKSAALTKAGRQTDAELRQAGRRADAAEQLAGEREAALGRMREDAKATAGDLSRSIDKLRAEKQKLQADLVEARAKAAQLQRELAGLKRRVVAPEAPAADLRDPVVSDLRRRSAVSD